jgi:hypothetical protein
MQKSISLQSNTRDKAYLNITELRAGDTKANKKPTLIDLVILETVLLFSTIIVNNFHQLI